MDFQIFSGFLWAVKLSALGDGYCNYGKTLEFTMKFSKKYNRKIYVLFYSASTVFFIIIIQVYFGVDVANLVLE